MSEKAQAPQTTLPTKIGLLVFPTFEPLDAFGPIEALHLLALSQKLELYVIGPTLTPVYTAVPPSGMNPAGSTFGIRIVPTHTYDTVPDDLEVLLVPGGLGAHEPRAGVDVTPMAEFIKKTYPKLKYIIAICNGAGLLAKAGILDGKKATTNKAAWKGTTAMGPNVEWVRSARWVVDGNCWTSGGVSAGLDVILAWIKEVYGEEKVTNVRDAMEYEWRDDKNWDPFSYMFGDGLDISA